MNDELKVIISRHPNNYTKQAAFPISEIDGVRWDNISGGVHRRQSGYSLYGYADYDSVKDLINCSGRHTGRGNYIKICIPATPNKVSPYNKAYKILLESAGPKPKNPFPSRPQGALPCTKRILKILNEQDSITRKELRDLLNSEKYTTQCVRNAINRLKKQEKITLIGSPWSPRQIITLSSKE